MRELKRGQIKRIIEEAIRLAGEFGGRDEIHLQEIYRIAEIVKGGKLTKREKLRIVGIVRRNYPAHREIRNNELKVMIMI